MALVRRGYAWWGTDIGWRVLLRFSLLWAPTVEGLGVALRTNADVAWPHVLEALRAWQAEFLSGAGRSHKPPTVGGEEGLEDGGGEEGLQTIGQRFQWHLAEGSVERSGGCTDAAMRLTNLLKVLEPGCALRFLPT